MLTPVEQDKPLDNDMVMSEERTHSDEEDFVDKDVTKVKRRAVDPEVKTVGRSCLERWVPLRRLKKSNPVEVAEFVIAKGKKDEPAFA